MWLWPAFREVIRPAGQMAMHLIIYWGSRGSFGDVRRVLTAVSDAAPENSQARARLLLLVTIVALIQSDWDAVYALAREIRRMATLLKDYEAHGVVLGR